MEGGDRFDLLLLVVVPVPSSPSSPFIVHEFRYHTCGSNFSSCKVSDMRFLTSTNVSEKCRFRVTSRT